MIRRCTDADLAAMDSVINEAALAYRGVIPEDCWHEPYMSATELRAEVESGVEFWAWVDAEALVGIMGIQRVQDAWLIRHAYVRTGSQGRGVGSELLRLLIDRAEGRLLVGTWAAAEWAIRFYERHGFRLAGAGEKDRLLGRYWTISDRQRDVSVVLELNR